MPTVIVRTPGEQDAVYNFDQPEITVGRSLKSDVKLTDSRLSRHHCSILKEDGKYFVLDKGSSNGTYLNCLRVDKNELSPGDAIICGGHVVFFENVPDDCRQYEEFAKLDDKEGQWQKTIVAFSPGDLIKSETRDEAIYVLEMVEGGQPGKIFHLGKEKVTIGRNDQNTIVVKDPLASNFHAEVIFDRDFYNLVDLGSTNGTLLNGEKIIKAPLAVGMEIRIGECLLIFKNIGKTMPRDSMFQGKETADARTKRLETKRKSMALYYIIAAAVVAIIVLAAMNMQPNEPVMPSPSPTPTPNYTNMLVSNPSFEGAVATDATPEGWTFVDVDNSVNVFVDKAKFRTGGQSLAFKNLGGGAGKLTRNVVTLLEDPKVVPGKNYVAVAHIITENAIGYNGVMVEVFNSANESVKLRYYSVPVLRTHTEFVAANCEFAVPDWANKVRISCVSAGTRGDAWFDDIAFHEGANDTQNIKTFDLAQGNRLYLDRQGHFWLRNRAKDLLAVGAGLTLAFKEGGYSPAGMFATDPTLRSLKANVSGVAGGEVLHPLTNSSADYKLSLAVDGEQSSLTYTLKAKEGFALGNIVSELYLSAKQFGGKASAFVNGSMVALSPGKLDGVTEMLLGGGKNSFSFAFGKPVSADVEQVGEGFLKVEASLGESTVNAAGVQIACVMSKDSPGIRGYAQAKIEKATALLGGGDLEEARRLLAALKAEFPDDSFVLREVERGTQSIDSKVAELKRELNALSAQLADVAKAGDAAKFEELLSRLVAHVELIKVRAPGSSLAEEAEAALTKSEGLNESIAAKLMEGKAAKLLEMANKAFDENKAVLALAILDTVARNYPATSAAKGMAPMRTKVAERVEQLRKATEEWPAVRETAEKLAKRGDVGGARKQVEEFLKKFPDFVPARDFMLTLQ